MYIIGVTGGIACGKSMVSNELRKFGARIISADNMIHWLMKPHHEIYNSYVNHFGSDILLKNGQLNRRKIASIVFKDKSQLEWINNETHPILLKLIRERIVAYQRKGVSVVVLDIPLLFEAGWDKECDEVWVVYLKKSLPIKRLMERNQLTQEQAEARIGAQLSAKERLMRADIIINNSTDKTDTRLQVKRLMERKFPHLLKKYIKYQISELNLLNAKRMEIVRLLSN